MGMIWGRVIRVGLCRLYKSLPRELISTLSGFSPPTSPLSVAETSRRLQAWVNRGDPLPAVVGNQQLLARAAWDASLMWSPGQCS